MNFIESFRESIFNIDENSFQEYALALFDYQFHQNKVYQEYCQHLKKRPGMISNIREIPFLPIEFFKDHIIKSGQWKEERIFMSSGTTGQKRSKHYVRHTDFYEEVSLRGFEASYGNLSEHLLCAILPNYIEQGNSSLVHMVDHFMNYTLPQSGFYLNNSEELPLASIDKDQKVWIIGVSYALLDLNLTQLNRPDNLIIMETGGMKGRKKEMTREQLHANLIENFSVSCIHSEYGMTELMSQAYAHQNGIFKWPKWVQSLVRDVNDPFHYVQMEKTGGLNIIDLANMDTCAFIETKDLGKQLSNHCFEILGRYDNTDIRGCNLMF
jgi:hypothetical protein